jgi:tRNA(adenine34) deaminase
VKQGLLSDEYFMKQAMIEAKKAYDIDEIPVGAIVVANNVIIARAHNLTEMLNDATAHAEMQALTAAANSIGSKYLIECTLFVTLEPCIMCAGALFWAQLGKLVYGASDPKRGYTLNDKSVLHPKTEVISGILSKDSEEILTEFFRKKRSG